jgi:membrane protein CcdC involved in cytochrome C biogenesis
MNADLYVGLFLAFVSSAFLIQSDNVLVIVLSGMTFLVALGLIVRWMMRYFRKIFR